MKRIILRLTLVIAISFAIVSCKKSEISPVSNSGVSSTINPKSSARERESVYANLSCTTPDGKTGCNCTITPSDDDCSKQTDCTSSSALPHYNDQLHKMFSDAEIIDRCKNSVRITEPELIDALRLDGFPVN